MTIVSGPLTCLFAFQEESLDAFVQPETLDGANQYFCEKCNKKCDAHKVLFPCFSSSLVISGLSHFSFGILSCLCVRDQLLVVIVVMLSHYEEDLMAYIETRYHLFSFIW